MKILTFKKSKELSLGVELEFQLINPITFDLISRAKDLIRNIGTSKYRTHITPEVTQSMIEINSSIHFSVKDLHHELKDMRNFLLKQSKEVGICICGGGTHPFRKWALSKIYPTKRYKKLSHQYRFLSKRSTVFGFHVHIGCTNAEDALYLTHALARFIPHFIAISASSPFYEGIDTGFNTTRFTDFNSFPTSGIIPYLLTWEDFSHYFYKLKKLGVISSMKDFYWDIRPKPEFGTVEIRVCDTPLTIEKAAMIAAYIQTLSYFLLHEKPIEITHDLYYFYPHNRFLASRYGLEGHVIDSKRMQYIPMIEDIQETIKKIKKYAKKLNNSIYIAELAKNIARKKNDAKILKHFYKKYGSFPKVVHEQCIIWKNYQ
jgi:glutamate---cysteine ligase / carboxylate-amine ligase